MRNKDREVTDAEEALDILRRCDTIRLGLMDGDCPYVVPVSFGLDTEGGTVRIFVHGAPEGRKADCIAANPKACVEGDIFYGTERFHGGITARYESIIGHGVISEAEGEEKEHGLRKILEHYGQGGYSLEQCKGLSRTAVYKITLQGMTGKRNLPEGEATR